MHWLGYNDAVSLLNEAKTRIFQPTANFENFEIRLYFVSLLGMRLLCRHNFEHNRWLKESGNILE